MYKAYVTNLADVHPAANSDRLVAATVFGEGVIVSNDAFEGQTVLYFPTDGEIERWFGDRFTLFRKNEDGTTQGGYLENNGHVRAIKLRGNQSSGIVIPLDKVYAAFGDQKWTVGEGVYEINGKFFCKKYIPKQSSPRTHTKTSYKGRKAEGIEYPEFSMHEDTAQLAYNLHEFSPGDIINLSLKMHGTSQRSMRTEAVLPNNWFRRLFHMKRKTKEVYVCGTRRTVLTSTEGGFYGNDAFRFANHERIKDYVTKGMEVFYEVVGWYGSGETDTIMPIADNSKMNDKQFVKEFGAQTVFSYGCEPGKCDMYVYRINDNGKEYSPEEIVDWCEKAGVNHVPYIENFVFTSVEDLQERINKYLEDLRDPVGKTHIKEGVVVRILNRNDPEGKPRWKAFKSKSYEFKVLEGIIKETETAPDMEEAEEAVE